MVTAEHRKQYDWSIKTRVKKLSEAIAQKEVLELLMKHSWHELSDNVISTMAKRIRVEIDRLGSTDISLGSKTTIHELDIPHIHDRIQKAAPALCKLLFALLEPKHPSKTSLRLIKVWLLSSPLLLHMPMHPTHMILFRCFWHIFIQWASNVEA